MKLAELTLLFSRLEKARAAAKPLLASLKACNLTGHQMAISLNVADVGTIPLSYMDNHYMQRLVRGRELIMLGVKKNLNAQLDALRVEIIELETAIKAARVTP